MLEPRNPKSVLLGQNLGFDRTTIPLEVLGENSFLASSAYVGCWHSLAYSPSMHYLPLFSHHLLLCMSNLPLPLIRTRVMALRAHVDNLGSFCKKYIM